MAAEELDQSRFGKRGDRLGEGDDGMVPGEVSTWQLTSLRLWWDHHMERESDLSGEAIEKDPGEDEGGGGMRVRHAVSIISCPILTCPF